MGEAAAAAGPIPLATGDRLEWTDVPGRVRAAVEGQLGSPVVSATNQRGGFSPGPAARVRCADGTRAFVKAAGSTLNPDAPRLHRDEGSVAAALPDWVPAPRLLHLYDDGDWVALVYEELPGRPPAVPWRPAELRAVQRTLGVLAERGTPCPVAGLPGAESRVAPMFGAYRLLAEDPAVLTGFERAHLDTLLAAESLLGALAGDTLVHMDLRGDNVLLGGAGQVWLVDWPWTVRGARWIDSATLAMEVAVHGLDAESYVDSDPILSTVDPTELTAFVVALAGMFARNHRLPDPPGLPTLRAYQKACHAGVLSWLRRRI
jgi:hypothetical protein